MMQFENINTLVTSIRQQKPLILNVTNDVTMDFIANGVLSAGASPVMSKAEEEMEDLIRIASSVVINLGTLDEKFIRLCERVAHIANQMNKPIILDPVGAGASRYRTETSIKLLKQYQISIVRGNASEILALSGQAGNTKGVESTAKSDAVIDNAKSVSQHYSVAVLTSGKKDVIVEGDRVEIFERGSALMPMITGSGCLLSAIVGSFHAVEKNRFNAAVAAAIYYGVCGEVAALQASGPASFKIKFLDALHSTPEKTWYEKN